MQIVSTDELDRLVRESAGLLAYFTAPGCSVCKVLRPKIEETLATRFPRLKIVGVDCQESRRAASDYQVLSVPTVIVFFDGQETVRLVRAFGVAELADKLHRPYTLMFE
jgi:thioredoxin 1